MGEIMLMKQNIMRISLLIIAHVGCLSFGYLTDAILA